LQSEWLQSLHYQRWLKKPDRLFRVDTRLRTNDGPTPRGLLKKSVLAGRRQVSALSRLPEAVQLA
jgi:hypothetical protein